MAETVIEMEPVFIEVRADHEGGVETDAEDLRERIRRAGRLLVEGDAAQAQALYEAALPFVRDDELLRALLFNLGLAHEAQQAWEASAARFGEVIAGWRGHPDAGHAMLRVAEAWAQLERWEAIPSLMQEHGQRGGLPLVERLEGMVRLASALLELRRFTEAARAYDAVLARNAEASAAWDPQRVRPEQRPLRASHGLISQARYGRARVFHLLALGVHLRMPNEVLRQDLATFRQLIDEAREAYLEALAGGHPLWAARAGLMVGQLFEDTYATVLAAEVPAGFSALESAIYFHELRRFLRRDLEHAIRVYQEAMAMCYRIGAPSSFVEEAQARIVRLRAYLDERLAWATEERWVLDGIHPRSYPRGARWRYHTDPPD